MTNRRANYPPVPGNRHTVRKTAPFAFHRTRMSVAVAAALAELRAKHLANIEREGLPTPPWPWSWWEMLKLKCRRLWWWLRWATLWRGRF